MKLLTFAIIIAVLPVAALADAMKGAQLSASCAHCHGTDGNSSSAQYPVLAGQTPEYLYRQLNDFKEGRRKDPMMSPMVGILSDEDMRNLADFYWSQSTSRNNFKTDPALVAQGKKIVEEAKCNACHPPSFKGAKEVPRVSRQKYAYVVKQLKDYRDNVRTNDNGQMAPSVNGMSDEQIEALAQYLASL
jgi:cytochrome c553